MRKLILLCLITILLVPFISGDEIYNNFTSVAMTTDQSSSWENQLIDNQPKAIPTLTVSPSSLSNFSYAYGHGPSGIQSFTVSGSNLTNSVIITAPDKYEISLYGGTSFIGQSAITLSGTSINKTIYVRLKSGLATGTYNQSVLAQTTYLSGYIPVTITQPVICYGSVFQPTLSVTSSSLSGFNYNEGAGPSAEQYFTISGSNLVANIVITPPTEYEISKYTGSSFSAQNPITLTPTAGSVPNTKIYVRLKSGLSAGYYNNKYITATSTYATSKTISCNGQVYDPEITVSPTSLSNFSYIIDNGPSAEQSFTVSGSHLSANIIINASVNYEIKKIGDSYFGSQITLAQSNGNVYSTTIYVRLKAGLNAATYNQTITVSSNYANNKTVACSGRVYNPQIIENPSSLSNFAYNFGAGPSPEQIFTISASDLVADLSISAPMHYEISKKSGSEFGSFITLTPSEGTVSSTTIYVRLKANLAIGTYNNENITASSTGVTSQTVTCYGEVLSKPEPTNNVTNFMVESVTASQIKLTWTDATKIAPDGYLIKGSSLNYADINDPVDSIPESNSLLVQNVSPGEGEFIFTNLEESTTYYFKIFPYTNSGQYINYKTDNVQQTSGTTLSIQHLSAGDIAVIGFQSDDPDKIAILLLNAIDEGTEIKITDNGYDGSVLATTEGTLTWTIPQGGLLRGTVVVFSYDNGNWSTNNVGNVSVTGTFNLSTEGDQIIIYQSSNSNLTFIYALSNTVWLSSGLISENTSYLPNGLVNETSAIDFKNEFDNGCYHVQHHTNIPLNTLSSISNERNWFLNNNLVSFINWNFEIFDYLNGIPVVENGVTITITGGNVNKGHNPIPNIYNPNHTSYNVFRFVLNTNTANWTITMQTNAPYGAYYLNGSWHTETNSGNQIVFNINFGKGKGDVEVPVILGDEPPTLQVELSTFTININSQQGINVMWVTQSESGMNGYYVHRATVNELSQAVRVSSLIPATNTSQQQIYVYTDKDIYEPGTYYYWLEAEDYDGYVTYYGSRSIDYENGNSGTPDIPLMTGIRSLFPNPFNPDATIIYELNQSAEVTIDIYNTRGQLVRNYPLGQKERGRYKLIWQGDDNYNNPCGNGIYYIKMQAGKEISIKKATLMK